MILQYILSCILLTYPQIYVFTGNKVEKLCDLCNITVNKNAVFGDSSALAPGGVRIGRCYTFKVSTKVVSRKCPFHEMFLVSPRFKWNKVNRFNVKLSLPKLLILSKDSFCQIWRS